MRARGRCIVTVLATACLVGCSPALNWREMDLAEADGLRLRLPCKPSLVERSVRLEGVSGPLRMAMWSCEAAGANWVLSAARVDSATEVSAALLALASATEGNLAWADRRARQQAGAAAQPAWQRTDTGAAQVPGMTPQTAARGWRIEGLKPEGVSGAQPFAVDAWHFSHGLTVFQAAIWRGAAALPRQNGEDAVEVFRQSLHFPG